MTRGTLRHTAAALLHRFRIGRDPWRTRTLWCLDLETGGLDPARDPILSVGMVPVRDGVIAFAQAMHSLVHPTTPVTASSLTIHHILSRDLADAPSPDQVLPAVADRLDRSVLIVHQRSMDVPFLHHAFAQAGIQRPTFAVIDTVDLLLRYAHRHGHITPERTEFPTGLAAARAHFGLPAHRAHEALSDAVATAELFLVLAHRLDATRVGHLI